MGWFWNIDNDLYSDVQIEEKEFDYKECKELYANWALGKRFVESIVDFSLSQKRVTSIPNAPQEVKDRFDLVCKKNKIDKVVKETAVLNRVYGIVGLFVATNLKEDKLKNLTIKGKQSLGLVFNILDPLNFKTIISQDPKSPYFQKPTNISVGGTDAGSERVYVGFNGSPLFVKWTKSALNFAGRSVFANMRRLIIAWTNLFEALERISLKASSILVTNNASVIKDPTGIKLAERSATLLKHMKQGQVAMLNKGETAEFFNLNGASEIGAMIAEVKEALTMALNDTPIQILLDKDLSNGLSNGSEDMRSIIIKVNSFREEYLNPIYDFLDKYMFYKAWNDDFINTIKNKYPQYAVLGNEQIRQMWINDFEYKWKSIYPKTPDEETKEKDGVLDRALKAKDLGVSTQDLQEILNNGENGAIFGFDVVVEKPTLSPFGENEYSGSF